MFSNSILLLLENELKAHKEENHKESCKKNLKSGEKRIVHFKIKCSGLPNGSPTE